MKRISQTILSPLLIVGLISVSGSIAAAQALPTDQATTGEVSSETFNEVSPETAGEALANEADEASTSAVTNPPAEVPADETGATVDEANERDPAQANRNSRNNRRRLAPGATPPRGAGRAQRANRPAAPAAVPADVQGLVVSQITINGNKKIELDAITARLVTKQGEPYSADKIRQDVEALFKTGYFYDVKVDRQVSGTNAALTYTVVEKPSVADIAYSGNKEVETDDIREATGIKAFEVLNMNKVREATEKIQKLYEDKGYFLARITPRIDNVVEGETVKLTFDIQENEKVKVKRITFLGNRNIPDGRLKSVMQTQEGGFFSFISGSGSYKQDVFDRDVQVLSYAYFNEGYIQVKVDRPQVYVTPDKKGIYITIRIEEGERFRIGTIDFAGDLLFERDDLFTSVDIDGSGWYVHETLLKDLRNLQAKYGDLGYAYANIIPRTRTRDKDKEVDITFEIDKGNKVYFGKINMIGNSRTRDKVVRRELTIREGELYNETRKRESLDNVRRLGFFEEVAFNSKTPSDNADLMDIDVVVKERNTGTIQIGAGYSTYQNFIFNGQVNQINLFGRGQKLGISVDISSANQIFNLNFTEPYFLDSNWSLGADIYRSSRDTLEYTEKKAGGAIRVGHPLAPYLRGFLRYKLDDTTIDLTKLGDETIFPTTTANGLTSSLTFTLEYDKRNDRFAPTDGVYGSGSLEYAGLGGSKDYTKGIFTGRFYKKVWWELVLRNNLTYGFIRSNDGDPVPYNELFLLGGANSLRGFDWYRVGQRRYSPKRYSCLTRPTFGPADEEECGPRSGGALSDEEAKRKAQLPYGGTQQLFYNLELEFPLVTEAGIKGVVFYDVGTAEDNLTELRHDVGFGFRWFSPIGPLRFEWGFPLNPQQDERANAFQFAIGSPF